MSRALLQTVNDSPQNVEINGILSPGRVVRRYGCNCQLNGNGQEVRGEGYYKLSGTVSVQPTAAGDVVVLLQENGVPIPGAIAYGTAAAAGGYVTLPLEATIRKGCCNDGASTITAVLQEGPGAVVNYSLRIDKD